MVVERGLSTTGSGYSSALFPPVVGSSPWSAPTMSIWKSLLGLILITLLAYWLLVLLSAETIPVASTPVENPVNGTSSLAVWLKALALGENCPRNGMIDSNGTSSYGKYCYQANTFIAFVREAEMAPHAERAEILNHIGDPEFQDHLTYWVFIHKPNVWKHWRNTVEKRIGLPPIDLSTHHEG